MITKFDAILSLVPTAKIVARGDEIEWHSPTTSPVTYEQINAEIMRLSSLIFIAQVKELRRSSLDKFVKNSPGISRVYSENYFAATEYQAGRTTTLMVCGVTVDAYLLSLGQNLGMTAAQFAAYIINENRGTVGLAIKVSAIEAEYVRLIYSAMPTMTAAQAEQAVTDYAAFCAARVP